MPLNVRRYSTSALILLLSLVFAAAAQTIPAPSPVQPAPTSGDVMRDRITKAKAFIAVRNYNAAIYELENIRKESGDAAVQGVSNVLLMNSYLEQGDYKRAQDLLNEFFAIQKTTKPNALASYLAVAGQVVKGARSRAERYKALGLSVADRMLPLEALTDLEKMRETLELVITQSKEIGTNKAKTADAMAMLEEAGNSRGMLARDDYDSRRWRDDVADTREKMASSRSVVLSAVDSTAENSSASNVTVADRNPTSQVVMQPAADTQAGLIRDREVKPANAAPDRPVYIPSTAPSQTPVQQTAAQAPKTQPTPEAKPVESKPLVEAPVKTAEPVSSAGSSPIDVGSLIAYATRQAPPVYPPAARSIHAMGIVRVDVTVNENGEVGEVQKTSGPSLLQAAAKDAIKKWRFKPFVRDGQPVKAIGYVSFNFAL